MGERYRLPLVLRYYNDLSYDEIAATLGLTRANVAVLIFRAKQELRAKLAKTAGTKEEWKCRHSERWYRLKRSGISTKE